VFGEVPVFNGSVQLNALMLHVARSVEPGEDWSWCYLDQVAFVLRPES
jgi:hypothetical protein